MSGESIHHVRLVEMLIATIRREHSARNGLIVLADHKEYGNDRPLPIGGYTPDVFASDLPCTFRVVGEAKTPKDLESSRSSLQIAAFLDHLSLHPNGRLYIAVPWTFTGRAQLILKSIRRPHHAGVVTTVLPGF